MVGNETANIRHQNALEHNAKLLQDIQDNLIITLGPQGLDIGLYSNIGDSVSTNDGLTALTNMNIEDPIYEELLHRAKTQEEICGDGTTSLSVIGAELVKLGFYGNRFNTIHPTVYIKGYKLALAKAKQLLDEYSIEIDTTDKANIKKFVKTTLSGKNLEGYDHIYDLCIDAVQLTEGNLDNINILPVMNGDIAQSRLINGIVLDLSVADKNMPKSLTRAKVLVLDQEIGQVNPAIDIRGNFTSVDDLMKFQETDELKAKEMTHPIIDAGVNVVFCQRDVNDYAIDILKRRNILCLKQVPKQYIDLISESTTSNVVKNIKTLSADDLGVADISIEQLTTENYVMIETNTNKVVTIIVGGSGKYTLDEYKRGIEDALGTIKTVMIDNRFVTGAGNIEIRLSEALSEYSREFDGLTSYVIEDYARALELIPRVLAVNCGIHPLIAVGEIRLNRTKNFGVNVAKGKIEDMSEVLEPTRTKKYILQGATEFACDNVLRMGRILNGRIDK